MAVANVLRGGILPRSSCNFIVFPSFFYPNKSTTVTSRKRICLFPSFCTNVDGSSAGTSQSSAASTSATRGIEARDNSTLSSITSSSDDLIRDAANMLDIRVGCIVKAWKHEEAETLYVEEVDVGELEPRIICSGLVDYIPLNHLLGKKVVVLANLKPRNMRGIKSCGMLLAASDESHEQVELLVPSNGSILGERLWFGSEDERKNQRDVATPNQIQKKKIWEMVQPHLKTDASCFAKLGAHLLRTSAGLVVCRSLKNAKIS